MVRIRYLGSYAKLRDRFLTLFLSFLSITIVSLIVIHGQNENIFEQSAIAPKKTKNNPRIKEILKHTPNLWRNEEYTVKERIFQQRHWIKEIADVVEVKEVIHNTIEWTCDFFDFVLILLLFGDELSPVKRILVEDDINIFIGPRDGSIFCPSAPSFANKCELVLMSPRERASVPRSYLYYLGNKNEIQILVSVRNAWSRYITQIPPWWPQIFFILEPPHKAEVPRIGETDAWLASYWRGSDIPIPYGMWVPQNHNLSIDLKTRVNFKSRRKIGVAMISNCESQGRLQYIEELRKNGVEIDVIGRCGNSSCPRGRNEERCLKMMEEDYKFFFAFENSRCEDYITEKLWETALKHDIIPVVRGARVSNYEDALPFNSFIHVDNFDSPADLAAHLIHLSQNEEEYLKYFRWKEFGGWVELGADDFFCRLCGMLYYAEYVPPPSWGNKNLMWADVNKCNAED